MLSRSAFPRRTLPTCPAHRQQHIFSARHSFHSSTRLRQREVPNHYETLSLPPTATPSEIKKQFYTLSKSNHPDLHPNDPGAAQRFVRISEAYATLSSPDKRRVYDRDLRETSASSPPPGFRRGSYSSASTTTSPGGRPASGLSRRRTQFRGPPPSFYRNGGWGEHTDKRSAYASQASHTDEARGRSASGPAGPSASQASSAEPGLGPGGFTAALDNDVPHFDHVGHHQTHETIEKMRRRARQAAAREEEVALGRGNSGAVNFFVMVGILSVIMAVTGVFSSGPVVSSGRQRKGKVEG